MSAPMIFEFIGQTITNATTSFVSPAASNLSLALETIAISGLTLYFCLMGYSIVSGAVQAPFWTFCKTCAKAGFICLMAFNTANYTSYVVNTFSGLQSGLASALNVNGTEQSNATIYQTLDSSLGQAFDLAGEANQHVQSAGFTDFGMAASWLIVELVIAISASIMLLIGGAIIILAVVGLALMMAIGPLFIMCLMFPIFARFFDMWFGQSLNYVLTVVLASVVVNFAMSAFNAMVSAANLNNAGIDNPLWTALQIGILCGIFCWILKHVPAKASALAGGASMAAMGITHLISPVTAGSRAAKGVTNMVNPQSTRRDLTTGQMVTASRSAHIASGNTVMNPAYRQALRENIGRNWAPRSGGSVSGD